MKTIWKFELKIVDEQLIEMPKDAKILTVQELAGSFCIWAIVDPYPPESEMRIFHVYGTGNPMPDIDLMTRTRSYIGDCAASGILRLARI